MQTETSQRKDTETRDRILEAARTAFQEQGTAGARMQQIADRAGVNKALLHYYFRNKETLAAAVFQVELQRLLQPLLDGLAEEGSLRDKVRWIVERYVDELSRNPGLSAYVLSELNFHPERVRADLGSVMDKTPDAMTQSALTTLRWQIAAESARGNMRPIAPDEFVVHLLALCVFPFAARPLVEFLVLGEGEFERFVAEQKRRLPELFLQGLRP